MTNSLAAGVAWVQAHPTRRNVPGASYRIGYGWSWSQLCVALVFWAVGATHTYVSANAARMNSTIESTSRDVPDGAFVWFNMGAYGHVGFWKGGVFYSATRFASNLGSALGTMTLEEYERASGGRYLGWSWDFGGQRFASTSIAGVGTVTPVTSPKARRRQRMSIMYLDSSTLVNGSAVEGTTHRALAGGSPGTPANWIETTSVGLGNAWSAWFGGPEVPVDHASFVAYRSWYLAPVTVAGGTSSGTTNLQPVIDQVKASEAVITTAIGKIPAAPTRFEAVQ